MNKVNQLAWRTTATHKQLIGFEVPAGPHSAPPTIRVFAYELTPDELRDLHRACADCLAHLQALGLSTPAPEVLP